jgi:nitrite reductase/ring-hydroxylating ferredoxin subunit
MWEKQRLFQTNQGSVSGLAIKNMYTAHLGACSHRDCADSLSREDLVSTSAIYGQIWNKTFNMAF